MPAKIVNDDAAILNKRIALGLFAGKPAPTVGASARQRFFHRNTRQLQPRRRVVNLWRAGLSNRRTDRVGGRSASDEEEGGVSGTPLHLVLGLLRSPTRGKPARHR